jgi:phage repressor protein C with HTH and peptisase S24 domain
MEPRIEHGAKVLIRLDPNAPAKEIGAASNGKGSIFLKRLMRCPARLELHSLNDRFPPITNLSGWTLRDGVTMIQHSYNGAPNVEWDDRRFLF